MATWYEDLEAAGYIGKIFLWAPDGTCLFNDPTLSDADRQAIEQIFIDHAAEQPFAMIPPGVTAPPMLMGADGRLVATEQSVAPGWSPPDENTPAPWGISAPAGPPMPSSRTVVIVTAPEPDLTEPLPPGPP